MKRLFAIMLCALLTAAAVAFSASAFAQCNIDFDFGEQPFGVSPDPTVGESFNAGVLDEDYFDVLHILIPSTFAGIDSAYPPQLAVDSVIVMADMVNGSGEYSGIVFTDTTTMEEFHAADIGLEVVLNNDNASPNESTFLGGDQYCAAIQGIPTRDGVYRIAIGIQAWATIAAPFSVPYVFDNFLLRVNCPLVDSINVENYNSIEGTDGQLTVILAAGVDSDDITWYNELGGEVGTGDSISVNQSGLYTVLVNTDSCSSEVSGILVEDEGLDCNLAATVDVVPASEGMADGQATVFITGASGEVQVNWYDEFGLLLGTEPFIEYLLSGVYSVVVTDELGCTLEINDVDATSAGSCPADIDADGVCDDIDDCVGALDECGVCNGPGEIYECGCADIPDGDCDCNGNIIDVLGVCGGLCAVDNDNNGVCDDQEIYGCTYSQASNFLPEATRDDGSCNLEDGGNPLCDLEYDGNGDGSVGSSDLLGLLTEFGAECTLETAFICGDPVSYQGYDYATVLIGEQCWFAENLRNENYENGDVISTGLSDSDWAGMTSGAVAVYGEDAGCTNDSPDIDACDPSQSLIEYGRLYNWFAIDDVRGLCPSGWHVPTDVEWMNMEMALGMSEAEANSSGLRGTNQDLQMKTDYGWYGGGNGTNSSGFSGLPGGSRDDYNGNFSDAGDGGIWWSSSLSGSNAWVRFLDYTDEGVYRYDLNPLYGFSVRCIQDTE